MTCWATVGNEKVKAEQKDRAVGRKKIPVPREHRQPAREHGDRERSRQGKGSDSWKQLRYRLWSKSCNSRSTRGGGKRGPQGRGKEVRGENIRGIFQEGDVHLLKKRNQYATRIKKKEGMKRAGFE